MVKTFRKLAALTAAVALVSSFAVCASATVTVNTTTSYVDADTVNVRAVVVGDAGELGNNANVTYYATSPAAEETPTKGIVYIEQRTASNHKVTFEFETDAAYINSAVKVSYAKATTAVESTIPDVVEYCNITVTGPNGSASTTFVKGADPDGTYTVAYTPTTGKYVSELQVTGGDAIIVTPGANSLTFTLSNFVETSTDITITATESYNATGNETGRVVNAGGIIAGEDSNAAIEGGDAVAYEGFKAQAGNRKLTVIGNVAGLAEDADYGVIVTADTIDATATTLPGTGCYAAKGKDSNGYFAVQLIDTHADAETATFIKPGVDYNTAVYFKNGSEYRIVLGNVVTIPVAQ